MANFAVDLCPRVPFGYSLVDWPLCPALRQEVFLIGCYSLANEDLTIVKLDPLVDKDDFKFITTELHRFFSEVHRAHVVEICPSALGEAYVRFGSSLERERFTMLDLLIWIRKHGLCLLPFLRI
jgi:hypothetical protein